MWKIMMIGSQWFKRRRVGQAAPVAVQVRRATLPPQWEKTLAPAKKGAVG
jgi:hypothetical protein